MILNVLYLFDKYYIILQKDISVNYEFQLNLIITTKNDFKIYELWWIIKIILYTQIV